MVAAIHARLWAPLPIRRLAAMRFLVGMFALGQLGYRANMVMHESRLDPDHFAPVGPLGWLLTRPLAPALVTALIVTTLVLSLLFALGLFHRVIGPLFALAVLWMTSYRSSWGMLFHSENLLVLHAFVLAVAPAAQVWSLDAWRARHRTQPPATDPDAAAGFALRLIAALTVATYFIAGVAKLRNSGWDWVSGDLLRNHVAFDNLRKAELGAGFSRLGAAMLAHAWLFRPLALFSVVIELGAPLALIHRRAAQGWALAAFGFHLGILLLMHLPFLYPLSGVAFAGLFPLERLPDLARRLRRRAPPAPSPPSAPAPAR